MSDRKINVLVDAVRNGRYDPFSVGTQIRINKRNDNWMNLAQYLVDKGYAVYGDDVVDLATINITESGYNYVVLELL